MQTCYNCGKQVEDNVLICPDCGALVKRYTTPTREETPTSEPMPQSIATGGARRIFADEQGKLHLRGGILAWLIFAIVGAGYLAFSMLFSIYIGSFPELFTDLFAAVPELAPIEDLLFQIIDLLSAFRGLFAVFAVLSVGKLIAGICFVAGKRRIAHTLLLVFTGILAALFLRFGVLSEGLPLLLDFLLTLFLLKNDRAMMR